MDQRFNDILYDRKKCNFLENGRRLTIENSFLNKIGFFILDVKKFNKFIR